MPILARQCDVNEIGLSGLQRSPVFVFQGVAMGLGGCGRGDSSGGAAHKGRLISPLKVPEKKGTTKAFMLFATTSLARFSAYLDHRESKFFKPVRRRD